MDSSEVETRLTALEARLSTIESRFKTSDETFSDGYEVASTPPSTPAPLSARPNTKDRLCHTNSSYDEERLGNWLGIIAVICFVLAAGLIVKLSVVTDWLTHTRQMGIATLRDFGLIRAGLGLIQSGPSLC